MSTVLITGAGGSIGSELVYQLINQGSIKYLILNDISESALFEVFAKSIDLNKNLEVIPIVGDIASPSVIEAIKKNYPVGHIYNAAAYKHVYLSTFAPQIYLDNNLSATMACLDIATACMAQLIHISTDKAVDPISPMGATKRICEIKLLKSEYSKLGKIKIVRFGNVLNSSGSVVPIFRSQITNRSQVTITDPKAKRYFMTIEQAVSLVIDSAGTKPHEKILVLDMGDPVIIEQVARNMIAEAGLKATLDVPENDKEIQIKYIGLRAGEKLEEKLTNGELISTKLENIFFAKENLNDLNKITKSFSFNLDLKNSY